MYFDIANLNSPYICGDNLNFDFASFIVFSPWNRDACSSMKVPKQIVTKGQVIESVSIHKTVCKVFKHIFYCHCKPNLSSVSFGCLLKVQPALTLMGKINSD